LATIGDSHPTSRTLDPLIDILLPEDGHNLHGIVFNFFGQRLMGATDILG
jgi:hypothetical protein